MAKEARAHATRYRRPVARKAPFPAAACLVACLLWLDAPGFESPVELSPAPERATTDEPGSLPGRPSDVPAPHVELADLRDEQGGIEVMVLSSSGTKASGATVLAVGPGLWPARKTETGPDGYARLVGLEAGVYDLRATQGEEVVAAPVTLILSRADKESVTLRMVKGRQVKVRVVDGEDGTAVAAASVVLAEGGLSPFPLEAVTGQDGVAVFGPVAPSKATISARAKGFVPRSNVTVPTSGSAEVEVALVRGGSLVGEVVDARGRAIDGARIEVIGTDISGAPVAETSETLAFRAAHFTFALSGPRPLLPAGELGVMPGRVPDIPRGPGVMPPMKVPESGEGIEPWVTRDDGTFRASPVSPGRLHVIARHPDFVEVISKPLRLEPGEESRVKLVMRSGGTLEGKVVDDRGEPVPRARVDVVATRGTLAETLVTGEDGNFTLKAVPDRLSVTVTRPGLADVTAYREQVSVKEGQTKSLEIKLPPLRESVLVRVTDEQNRPLANAQVSVASLSPKAELRRTRFTTEEGQVDFNDARGLPLLLEVTLPGRAPAVMELDEAPAEVTVELARGVTVVGSVTTRRGHDPLPGAEVTLHTKTGARHVKTDARGGFQLEEISEGPARLVVARAGHVRAEREVTIERPRHEQPFEIDAIDLAEAGSVEGEVVDGRGKPIAGARVAKDTVPAYLPGGRLPPSVVTTDREGRFQLDELPEGEVTLEAFSREQGRARVQVNVTAGRVTDRVKLILEGAEADVTDELSHAHGVAVTLGERDVEDGVHVIVVLVTEGSEAERGGLRRGDRILSIDGEATSSMREARAKLTGPLSNDVLIEVERDEARQRLRVGREPLER